MSGRFTYSLDDNIDYFSKLADSYEPIEYESKKDLFTNIENKDVIFDFLKRLSFIDATFIMLSYMYKMSQTSISKLLSYAYMNTINIKGVNSSITQVGVSVRIRRAFEKIQFLLKCPKLDFISVRDDFKLMFPKNLFDVAFFFYWNHTQSRTKHFLNITQCGSAFKLDEVILFLEKTINKEDNDDLVFLANTYLQFFKTIRDQSNTLNIFFRNDFEINRRLEERSSII